MVPVDELFHESYCESETRIWGRYAVPGMPARFMAGRASWVG